jgi:phosphomannomutase
MHLIETLQYAPEELSFGTSGLRGLVTDMTDLECYINTRGFLEFLEVDGSAKKGVTVYLAGDLRESTPRILLAVHQAITDAGFKTVNCGLIPTPAVAYYALRQDAPCIMITGSHIPADRNGIKFYKKTGEVLKEDELAIKQAVAEVRQRLYEQAAEESAFNTTGMLRGALELPVEDKAAREGYIERYASVFAGDALVGKEIIFYQHSAVGRDMLVEILQKLGANVVPVGRSEVFVPIDSENVTPDDKIYFHQLAEQHPNMFAIASTDGDSDRPFVIDAQGDFHRGDVLGAVVAEWVQADFAAFPVSVSDAVNDYLYSKQVAYKHTKIGSPYVVSAMQVATANGHSRVTGWEVNGGFMLGCDVSLSRGTLKALPTRDAILPIIVALVAAVESNQSVTELFSRLPARYTQAGMINNFPTHVSQSIAASFSQDTPEVRAKLGIFFTPEHGFTDITGLELLDGIRIFFANGDIAHLRPSGNAPQLRIYSVADSQSRADEIVALAIAEPDGIFRKLEREITRI